MVCQVLAGIVSLFPKSVDDDIIVDSALEQCRLVVGLDGDVGELLQIDLNPVHLAQRRREAVTEGVSQELDAVLVAVFDLVLFFS